MKVGVGTMRAVLAFILLGASSVGAEQPGAQPTKMTLQLSDIGDYWSGDASPKTNGGQNFASLMMAYAAGDYGLTLTGGYATTSYIYNSQTKEDFNLSSFLDSSLSAYYVTPKLMDLNFRLGLDFNLPTGHAGFTNRQINSILIDNVAKELAPVSSFGRGFDVAPSITASLGRKNTLYGLGVRYLLPGQYNPAPEQQNKEYLQGDAITIFGSLVHNHTPSDQLLIDISGLFTARDRQGGLEVLKQGNAYNLNLRYIKSLRALRMTFGASGGIQEKNQIFGAGGFTTEDRNTNNNYYEAYLNGSYVYSPKFTLNALAGYKDNLANG